MDLLGQELNNNKKQMPASKKFVLISLIVCIVLLIIILAVMFMLSANKAGTLTLSVNGNNVQLTDSIFTADESGTTYISIEQLSKLTELDYIKGGYLEYGEDDKKCYLRNSEQIIGFEEGTNKVYKLALNTNLDYEYYDLKNKIIKLNDVLYIALDDLNVGCGVVCTFFKEDNRLVINTTEYETKEKQNSFGESAVKVSDDFNNRRALPYNMIVVTNENGKMGVINSDLTPIINYGYDTIEFDEFSQNFIVSKENLYGIISDRGREITSLRYEEISIINYSPLLYKVKIDDKYGILDETGKIVINIEYDEIGFNERTNRTEPALIIDNLKDNQIGIVVCKEEKYGIANLKTGAMIVNCELDKIYTRGTDNSQNKKYYIELQEHEFELDEYIEYINTTRVVTN